MNMSDPKTIAATLTQDQKNFLLYFYAAPGGKEYRNGSPRGLVARGLLGYAWGSNSSFGYKTTALGKQVVNELAKGE
jgi:hypothetical protein